MSNSILAIRPIPLYPLPCTAVVLARCENLVVFQSSLLVIVQNLTLSNVLRQHKSTLHRIMSINEHLISFPYKEQFSSGCFITLKDDSSDITVCLPPKTQHCGGILGSTVKVLFSSPEQRRRHSAALVPEISCPFHTGPYICRGVELFNKHGHHPIQCFLIICPSGDSGAADILERWNVWATQQRQIMLIVIRLREDRAWLIICSHDCCYLIWFSLNVREFLEGCNLL